MRPLALTALAAAALAAGLALARAQAVPASSGSVVPPETPPPAPALPAPPAHARRSLDSPAELARDLAEVVAYLDAGQAYFKGYQKGTHAPEENKQFLAFLEAYEKEYGVAKKEAAALKKWVDEQGSLDAVSK